MALRAGLSNLLKRGALAERQVLPALQQVRAFAAEPAAAAADVGTGSVTQMSSGEWMTGSLQPLLVWASPSLQGARLAPGRRSGLRWWGLARSNVPGPRLLMRHIARQPCRCSTRTDHLGTGLRGRWQRAIGRLRRGPERRWDRQLGAARLAVRAPLLALTWPLLPPSCVHVIGAVVDVHFEGARRGAQRRAACACAPGGPRGATLPALSPACCRCAPCCAAMLCGWRLASAPAALSWLFARPAPRRRRRCRRAAAHPQRAGGAGPRCAAGAGGGAAHWRPHCALHCHGDH